MTGKVIAVANMKGGVGKTTTVVSLAEALAAADERISVLVVDLDPQASASACIAGDDLLADIITEGRTIDIFLEQHFIRREPTQMTRKIRRHVSDVTHRGLPLNVSLLACSPHLRLVEREIIYELSDRDFGMRGIEGQLLQCLKREIAILRNQFDFVLFDCAPGISPLNEASIRLSDLIIVPTIADYLSTMGLNAFCRSLWSGPDAQRTGIPKPKMPHVLVTRWQQQVRQQNDVHSGMKVEAASIDAGFKLLRTRIPQAAALVDALTLTGTAPTFRYKYGPLVCNVLDLLVREVKGAFHAD